MADAIPVWRDHGEERWVGLGATDGPVKGSIYFHPGFVRAYDQAAVLAVMRHEIGHMLGLGHFGDANSVMHESPSSAYPPMDAATETGIRTLYLPDTC